MDSLVPLSVTVLGEARDLLNALRRNRRFGYLLSFTSSSQPSEHPLVKEVKSLRDVVRIPVSSSSNNCSPLWADGILIPPDNLLTALDPFFEVVKSRDASGIITGVALQSLNRIAARTIELSIAKDLLPQYAPVLSAIVDAVSQCRFDATDPASDEVVLARITNVISTISESSAFPLLADASILRSVEACLGIASGRRRASELLKRTADGALAIVMRSLGNNFSNLAANSDVNAGNEIPAVIAEGVSGPAFGFALDADSFNQHGPASMAVVIGLIDLCARLADPMLAKNSGEQALGLELLATLLSAGGSKLGSHDLVKQRLLRDCCRAILRTLGSYRAPSHIIAAAFQIAIQFIHVFDKDAAPFVLALLGSVFPYYISGYENVAPNTRGEVEIPSPADSGNGSGAVKTTRNGSSGNLEGAVIEMDPVVREIGLESLAALLSTPGLLCFVYQLTDCNMTRMDIVQPLLKALGHASKTRRFKRRNKRLRASSSGTNRVTEASADIDSDEEDSLLMGNVNPEASRFSRASSLLCAESVLAIVDTVSDRLKLETAGLNSPAEMDYDALHRARKVRQAKTKLQAAAHVFNSDEKMNKASKLLKLLRGHGLVETRDSPNGTVSDDLDADVAAIVHFISNTPGLNKEKKGAILGEPDHLSRRVLEDYTGTFEFEDRPFTESLRVYLESFRLPGESQKIDRIVESFANRYFNQNKPLVNSTDTSNKNAPEKPTKQASGEEDDVSANGESNHNHDSASANGASPDLHVPEKGCRVFKNADAAHVLSYSVVLLNTDQHNHSIRKKMTFEDFVRNSRGINDREDLPRWFLAEIFESISAVEIRMSDEAGIGALTDVFWDEQIKQLEPDVTLLRSSRYSRVFDEDIFTLTWESAVVSANSILNEAADANSVQKALEGFLSVARCATSYRMSLPTDAVISSLCTATTIRDGPLFGAISRFGTDIKAQMASVALSGVARQCGDWLQCGGWQALVAYLLRLHALCLLPKELERKVGGYGSELVDVQKKELPSSSLIPAWWPSRPEKKDTENGKEKPKKASRPNGFFAAILAASIGSELDPEDEEDEELMSDSQGGSSGTGKISHVAPYFLRMRSKEDSEAQDLARKCIAGCRIEDVVITEAKVLQSSALEHLANAIARSAVRIMDSNEQKNANGEVVEEESNQTLSDSILEWADIAPPSPKHDSSAIAGVSSRNMSKMTMETESDFPSFSLAPTWEGALRERDERKAREFVTAFCVDVLCDLTLQNRDRLHIPWPALHSLIVRIISTANHPSPILERAVVALLRVGIRLLHRTEVHDDILRGLGLLVRLPTAAADSLSVPVAAGIYNIVKDHRPVIQTVSGWHAILSILENTARYDASAREIGLEALSCILKDQVASDTVYSEAYAPLLHAVLAYTSCPSVDISIHALELLYILSQRLCVVTTTDRSNDIGTRQIERVRFEAEMWQEYWNPLFLGFASAVRDSRGKVRNAALEVLERVIASGGSAELLTASQWGQALSTVILPLMNQLFSTHGFFNVTAEAERNAQRRLFAERNAASGRGRSRPFLTSPDHDEQLLRSVAAACNRTRMRASVLTSKTFLQHHISIAQGLPEDSFTQLWIGILEVFRVAVESGKAGVPELRGLAREKNGDNDDIVELVPENVKNLLLVMSDCGLLNQQQHVRWNATFAVVRKYLPDMEELISSATAVPGEKPNASPEKRSVAATTATVPLVEGNAITTTEGEAPVPVASTT